MTDDERYYPVAKIHLSTLRKISKVVRAVGHTGFHGDVDQRTMIYNETSRRILIVRDTHNCLPGNWWYLTEGRIGHPVEYGGKLIVEGQTAALRRRMPFDPKYDDDYDVLQNVYCEIIIVPDTEPEIIPTEATVNDVC